MTTIIDEWEQDGHSFTRSYTRNQILRELDDIWGSEEYENNDWLTHLREEHLTELLKQLETVHV